MGYLQIDSTYFEETPQGLKAVTDANLKSRLQAGQLPATKRTSKETAGLTFAGQKPLASMSQTGSSDLPQTESRASGYQNFAAALNKAVSLARNQRNDASLDLVGGKIKPGSVSASTFTSLLNDINTASEEFSEPLVTDALDVAKMEEERLAADRNSIRDLALSLATQGVSQETIQGLLAAPSMDVALPIATAALSAKASKGQVQQIGSKLVRVMPDGSVSVIFDGDTSGGGGLGIISTPPVPTFDQFIEQKQNELQQSIANPEEYRGEYNALVSNQSTAQMSPLAASVMKNPTLFTELTAGDKAQIIPELNAAGFKFPRKLGAEQEKAANIADSGLLALQEMESTITREDGTVDVGLVQANNPFSSFANYRRSITDAVSRLSSGAALTEQETKFYRTQTPGAFDTPEVIRQKQMQLAVFFSGISGNQITLSAPNGDVYVFEDMFDPEVRKDVRNAIENGYTLIDF